jgi:hypothetical protein
MVQIMQDSGGADTCGWGMLITSAVAILFSCFDWGTGMSQSLPLDGLAVVWSLKSGLFISLALEDTNPGDGKFRRP